MVMVMVVAKAGRNPQLAGCLLAVLLAGVILPDAVAPQIRGAGAVFCDPEVAWDPEDPQYVVSFSAQLISPRCGVLQPLVYTTVESAAHT